MLHKFKSLLTFKKTFILVILLFATFLRFWRVPELFIFGLDEEYQANLAWSLFDNFHIIWVGVSLSLGKAGFDGFYLGPGMTYLNAILFYISNGDPVILGFFGSFLGVLTCISIYYIAKQLYNNNIALVASIWYGFSALMIISDRRFWNLTPVPFISIWLFYSLVKAQKNTKWLILSSALLAASLHAHLILLVFIIPFLWTLKTKYKQVTIQTWILTVAIFIGITFPMIMFEYFKKGQNIFLPYRLLTSTNESSLNLITNINTLLQSVTQLFYSQPYVFYVVPTTIGILSLLAVLFCIYNVFKNDSSFKGTLLIFISLFYLIMIIFWPGKVHTHYLLAFFPLFALILGQTIIRLRPKILFVFLTVFIISNVFAIFNAPTNQGLASNKKLVIDISQYVGNRTFNLETKVDKFSAGFRYLFKIYGKLPNQSDTDDRFAWIFPDEIVYHDPELVVIIADKSPYEDKKPLKIITSDGFNAYIFPYEPK